MDISCFFLLPLIKENVIYWTIFWLFYYKQEQLQWWTYFHRFIKALDGFLDVYMNIYFSYDETVFYFSFSGSLFILHLNWHFCFRFFNIATNQETSRQYYAVVTFRGERLSAGCTHCTALASNERYCWLELYRAQSSIASCGQELHNA